MALVEPSKVLDSPILETAQCWRSTSCSWWGFGERYSRLVRLLALGRRGECASRTHPPTQKEMDSLPRLLSGKPLALVRRVRRSLGSFFSGHHLGSRLIWRLMVAVKPRIPRSSSNSSHCFSRVSLGLDRSCGGNRSCNAAPLFEGLPSIGSIPTSPVSRLLPVPALPLIAEQATWGIDFLLRWEAPYR